MDGVLLIDKPAGPTSHDVVARLRRAIGQRAIGHTGTLDPNATGLLPLVLGRATRIASLLSGGDKNYDASIRLGFATDTDDTEGSPLGEPATVLPDDAAVLDALEHFRGAFEQVPPAHSAKKVEGARAYDLARRSRHVALQPVTVTVHALEWVGRDGDAVHVRVTAASGFYVRALARDLGARLGCGGHLAALRRTRSGPFAVTDALPLLEAERLGRDVAPHVLSAAAALPELAAVRVTDLGRRRAMHGNPLQPQHVEGQWVPVLATAAPVKVLDEAGELIALARMRGGALHPVVVLG